MKKDIVLGLAANAAQIFIYLLVGFGAYLALEA